MQTVSLMEGSIKHHFSGFLKMTFWWEYPYLWIKKNYFQILLRNNDYLAIQSNFLRTKKWFKYHRLFSVDVCYVIIVMYYVGTSQTNFIF